MIDLSEIAVMLGGFALCAGEPLTAIQLLWFNLISDVFPSLALSMAPPADDVMDRPPRARNVPMVDRGRGRRMLLESIPISVAGLGAYLIGLRRHGPGARARTLSFTTLTCAQVLHALGCRSTARCVLPDKKRRRNPYLSAAVGGSLLLQILAFKIPPLRRLLGLTRLDRTDAVTAVAGAIGPLIVNELTKSKRSQNDPSIRPLV